MKDSKNYKSGGKSKIDPDNIHVFYRRPSEPNDSVPPDYIALVSLLVCGVGFLMEVEVFRFIYFIFYSILFSVKSLRLDCILFMHFITSEYEGARR